MTYALLHAHHRTLSHLSHVDAMASWDEAVMMPPGGGEARGEALATLRAFSHQLATRPVVGEWLDQAEHEPLEPWQRANLREMKRAYVRATALPPDLVAACSRAETRSEQAWRVLRAANDWAGFAPFLEEVVARKREAAQALGATLGLSPYDALLDGFEPGARSAEIDEVFRDLEAFLPGFIDRVVDRQAGERVVQPQGPFSVEAQRELGVMVMRHVGFDFDRGRLDVSHHPFCGGVPQDVRITTRYSTDDFTHSFMGVLHEAGHARYEQNLPRAWLDQPVGLARSMAVHESQSLLHEMQVGRSPAFLRFAAPLMARAFADAAARQPAAFTTENLLRVYTRVRRSLIRGHADECTYPCHVILRYDLEKALVAGTLPVADIPDAWAAAMSRLLRLDTRGNDKDGCMQDVHWPAGALGYFPTYTLGALLAAQLFAAARHDLPALDAQLESGDFTALAAWLRTRVWELGSFLTTQQLVVHATGAPLRAEAFKAHLHHRYLS